MVTELAIASNDLKLRVDGWGWSGQERHDGAELLLADVRPLIISINT